MNYVMQSWPVELIPLIFFGLVVPSLLSGGFRPALVRQKVVEMSLPIGAIGAVIIMVQLLQDLSDPSHLTPALIGLFAHMVLWGGFYFAARLTKTESLTDRTPFASHSILPVLAVLSMVLGWWASVAITSPISSYLSVDGFLGFIVFFGVVTLLRRFRKQELDVMIMAKTSVQAGCLTMLTGFGWMNMHLEDPSRIGPAMAMALLGGVYSLLFHQILILLSPLSPQIQFKKPEVGMIYGYLFHMAFLAASWVLLFALLD